MEDGGDGGMEGGIVSERERMGVREIEREIVTRRDGASSWRAAGEREKERERERERRDRETERQRDRETERQRDRERERGREIEN
jgi:hypothetical protein